MGKAKRLRKAKVKMHKEKELINYKIQVASNVLGISTKEMKEQMVFAIKNKSVIEKIFNTIVKNFSKR